jgi:hypothetical protein
VALACVVLLGCGGGGGFAAKVGRDTISASAMDRDLGDIARNERFVKARAEKGVAFFGTKPGTYDSGIVAELLTRKITALLVHQEVARRHLAVSADARTAAEKALRAQVVDTNGDPLLDLFPRRYVVAQVETQAESDVLQADEGEQAYPALLRKLRSGAVVTVSSRFGRWDTSDPERVRVVAR